MQRRQRQEGRRSYDQFCAVARALDAVGDRWTLLIARELLSGARRYTDLHADLPGVSTDILAARLKDMERDGLLARPRLPPPASGSAYDLTERGRALLPVLEALGAWGRAELHDRRPTDAVRAHWLALPLRSTLAEQGVRGVVDVRTDEGDFHLRLGEGGDCLLGEGAVGEGRAPAGADLLLDLGASTCVALCRGEVDLAAALADGRAVLSPVGRGAPGLGAVG